MRGGGDRLVGLEVEPLLGIRSEEVDLEEEFGMIQEKVSGEWIHALPAEEDKVLATIHGDIYGGVGVGSVAPMDGAVGVPEGKG